MNAAQVNPTVKDSLTVQPACNDEARETDGYPRTLTMAGGCLFLAEYRVGGMIHGRRLSLNGNLGKLSYAYHFTHFRELAA